MVVMLMGFLGLLYVFVLCFVVVLVGVVSLVSLLWLCY